MQFASLPDGKGWDHTYGRRNFKTPRGSSWECMGDDMAVSENPYRIQPVAGSDSFAFKMADIEFEIPSIQELRLWKKNYRGRKKGSAFGREIPLLLQVRDL